MNLADRAQLSENPVRGPIIAGQAEGGPHPSVNRGTGHGCRLAAVFRVFGLVVLLLGGRVQADAPYWVYTVRPGDNIWDLTKKYCTSVHHWQLIVAINQVRLDRQIPPGTKLRFPLRILKHQPASATVAHLQGGARLIRAGTPEAVALKVNTELSSGDRVLTDADANVTLRFADGSELLVLGDSEVEMDTLSAWGTTGMVDTRVRLQGGRVDTRVRPARGPGSRYQIITPAAVAAVRGTQFRVAAQREQAVTRSEVIAGTVGVGDPRSAQDIAAGFGVVAEAGQPPQAPRKLLPAPRLQTPTTALRQLPLQFSWTPLNGAKSYRFQIAPDTDFHTLLADELSLQATAKWPDLPDGHYALRVRGIDEVGLEGLDSIQPFEVDARPFAPLATGLTGGEVTRHAQPRFTWDATRGAKAYRFELASDAAFREVVMQTTVEADSLEAQQALAPGSYHWRVASIDAGGDQGPFSTPAQFTYRPLPDKPAPLAPPTIERKTLSFAWQPVTHAATYRFQLAQDPEFKGLVVEQTLAIPGTDIPRPPAQVYYARVCAENAAAEAGPFTQALEVEVPPPHYWGLLLFLIPLLLAL